MCRAAPACTKPGYASQSGANRHWNNTCLLNPNRTKRNRGRAGTVTTTDDAEDDAEEEAEAEVEEEAEDDVSVVSEAS